MATYTSEVRPAFYFPPVQKSMEAPQLKTQPIRDWLAWSIINIFVAWGLFAFVPLIFSLMCRSKKRKNNINGAQTMSTLALVFNITLTVLGVFGWISLIIYIIVYYAVINKSTSY